MKLRLDHGDFEVLSLVVLESRNRDRRRLEGVLPHDGVYIIPKRPRIGGLQRGMLMEELLEDPLPKMAGLRQLEVVGETLAQAAPPLSSTTR